MVHGTSDIEGKQGQKSSQRARKRFESPADTEPTRGLVGQVRESFDICQKKNTIQTTNSGSPS